MNLLFSWLKIFFCVIVLSVWVVMDSIFEFLVSVVMVSIDLMSCGWGNFGVLLNLFYCGLKWLVSDVLIFFSSDVVLMFGGEIWEGGSVVWFWMVVVMFLVLVLIFLWWFC